MAPSVKEMAAQLQRWAQAHHGPHAAVGSVSRLPGHSGISFAFEVHDGDAVDRLVIRIPPAGVPRSGITDVLRQVPLLQLMEREGVPVPSVRWWGEDERWFGVPYLIVDLVPGGTLGDIFHETVHVDDATPLFRQAVEALAHIHTADWRHGLPDWDVPRPLRVVLDRYGRFLERSPETDWIPQGHRLAAALRASIPDDPAPGVVHNDFYSNNWMFDDGALTGVLDWEGTFIGPSLLDVGWVCMMYDPPSWSPAHRERIAWSPPPELLLDVYAAAAGTPPTDVDWYRAFAGYRLSALTGYYLDLHRRGRRRDDVWENFAESVPYMLRRACEIAAA